MKRNQTKLRRIQFSEIQAGKLLSSQVLPCHLRRPNNFLSTGNEMYKKAQYMEYYSRDKFEQ